jgi:hypothetical protein
MAMFLQPGGEETKAVTLEDVAEEVLNGFFCHYEPPTSEEAQMKAAQQFRKNPRAAFPLLRKRSKSILKPSRLLKSSRKHARSVTWRDKPKPGDAMEEEVAGFMAPYCDFLGTSRDAGLTDVQQAKPPVVKSNKPPTINTNANNVTTTKSTDPIEKFREKKSPKMNDPPKHVLYDDEGNPMNEDGTTVADADEGQDENASPSPKDETPDTPTAPDSPTMLNPLCGIDSFCFGESMLKTSSKTAKAKQKRPVPANAFEPDTFKNPPLSQPLAYRRIRSPPARNRRSYKDEEPLEDDIGEENGVDYRPRRRSRSPMPRRRQSMNSLNSQNDSDGEELSLQEHGPRSLPRQSPVNKRKWYKPWKRPSTPYRRRDGEVGPHEDQDTQFNSEARGRSRSPGRVRMDGNDNALEDDYYRARSRRASRSPGRDRSASQERRYMEDRGRSRDRHYDDDDDRLPRSASSQRRYEEDRGRSRDRDGFEDRVARSASQERRYMEDYEDRGARSASQERRYMEDRGRSRDRDLDRDLDYEDRVARSASQERRYMEDRGRSRDRDLDRDLDYEDRVARSASQEHRYMEDRGRSRDRDLDYEDRVARSASQERRYMEGRGRSRDRDLDYEDRMPRSASTQRRYDEGRSRDYEAYELPREFDAMVDRRRSREFEDVDRRRSPDTGDDIDREHARDVEARPAPKTQEEERPRAREAPREQEEELSRGRRPPQLNTDREVILQDIVAMSPHTQRQWMLTKKGWTKNGEAAVDDRAEPKSSKPAQEGDQRANPVYEESPAATAYSRQPKSGRSRRVSDPVRPARLHETDGPDHKDDDRRPHTTASHQSRRGEPPPINTSSDQQDAIPPSMNRDPTPTRNREPDTIHEERNQGPLPPTPRRRQEDHYEDTREEEEDEQPVRSRASGRRDFDDDAVDKLRARSDQQREMPSQRRDLNVHTFQPPVETAQERKSRRALARTLSPKSISTEDEIREEVSSVGMESSTLRPYYANPFLEIPPPIIEDQERTNTDSDPSELTSPYPVVHHVAPLVLKPSRSSSNGSAPSGRSRKSGKSDKGGSRSELRAHNERERRERVQCDPCKLDKAAKQGGGSSSSSKKKKGLWKGFTKNFGMVKAIAKEIDAHRKNMPMSPGSAVGIGPMKPKKFSE